MVGGREAGLSALGSLRVMLPSGEAYWTVVDDDYRVVEAADAFLRVREINRELLADRNRSAP